MLGLPTLIVNYLLSIGKSGRDYSEKGDKGFEKNQRFCHISYTDVTATIQKSEVATPRPCPGEV